MLFYSLMSDQNLIQSNPIELIQVSKLLTHQDRIIIKNNPHVVYALPIQDSKGKFLGYRQLDSKVECNCKSLQSDSLGSQLLPIVTGG